MHTASGVTRSGVAILALLLGTLPAIAGSEAQYQRDPYAIGHMTLVLTDSSRNPDGSTPVTGAGRPLYVHVWYPSSSPAAQKIRYTWNNPVYNQNPGGAVYPGLPDTPALTFTGSASTSPKIGYWPS